MPAGYVHPTASHHQICCVDVKASRSSSRHGLARAIVALGATGCAALIVACGSSKMPGGTSGRSSSFVPFAACMRSHGVPNFPDPGSGPGGGVEIVPPGINTSAPAFKTAWSDCSKLLPVLGGHHPPSAQMVDQMLQFSRCMRAHGVTGFPDPTTTQLAPRSGYFTIRSGGVYLAIPNRINRASPTYQRAARACRFGPGFS